MSLEQAIHNRWAADASLPALLPAARFLTGPPLVRPSLPWAMLARQGTKSREPGSHYTLEETELAFTIWDRGLAAAKAIAAAVQTGYDHAGFAFTSGQVLALRLTDQREAREADGVWRITLTFTALIATTR